MTTDLRLDDVDGTYVVVEGSVLKATTTDFMLDSPTRHSNNHQFRRALVHNQQDGLTINYNNDYPGGVTINDIVALISRSHGITVSDVKEISGFKVSGAATGGSGGAGGSAGATSLVLRGEVLIEKNPSSSTASAETMSLHVALSELQSQVQHLTRRIADMEKRS